MQRITLILVAVVLFSCNGSKPKAENTINTIQVEAPRVKNVNGIKFEAPAKNGVYSYNSLIEIELNNTTDLPIDSIQLFFNNRKVETLVEGVLNYRMKIPDGNPGAKTWRLIAFHGENKRSTDSRTILVKPDKAPVKYSYELINTFPHDPNAYTQGLVYQDGYMYEGTGHYGKSGLRKTNITNGEVLSVLNIDSRLFGEGITIYNGKVYQLTWTSRKGFVYDLKTFAQEATFTYNTQGWGITTLGNELVMSDGSHQLYYISPGSFAPVKEIEVYDHNGPVRKLNELEYINGLIWANIWMENRIVMIDPATGEVKGELDMTELLPASDWDKLDRRDDVLNGIAWNPEKQTVYLTGKHWPKLFEIRVPALHK